MNERDKYIRPYTASDIAQYLDGKLSAAEMHALEKAAMDDPFLADAIEGIDLNNQQGHSSFETGLNDLKRRLQEKIDQGEKKNTIMPFSLRWQVAAAVGLLIISGAVSYTFLIKKSFADKEISQNRKTEPARDSMIHQVNPAPGAGQPDRDSPPVAKNNLAVPRHEEKDNPGAAKTRTKRTIGNPYEAIKRHLPVNQEIASADKADKARPIPPAVPEREESDTDGGKNNSPQEKGSGVNIQSRRKNANLSNQNYLQGFVTDRSGNPVSSATVSLKDKNAAVSTDKHGFFSLKTDSKDSNEDVVITSTGYLPDTASLIPSGKSDKIIQLREADKSLGEVVVTSPAAKKEKRILGYGEASDAEPGTGWEEYHHYLLKNKKINTADSTLKGIEIISFLVHKNGVLSHFKVEHSISLVHDAELIRLVKAGPPWKVIRGNNPRCSVSLSF